MPNLKDWISAARLRTLPLSVSGIIVGSSLAIKEPIWISPIFWLAIITTIGFQVLSNFANDYGDGLKGTDKNRLGEKRLVASGLISGPQMKRAMIIISICTLIVAVILIYMAFGRNHFLLSLLFFGLGLSSIIAAIKYTVGKNAYGYSGLGDIFVFLFFGLLSVLGSYFLFAKNLHLELLLPATTIGFLSMAVLNLNNMRDLENDAIHQKRTLAVTFGIEKTKLYHYTLLSLAMLFAIIYTCLNYTSPLQFIYIIAFIPLLINMKTVYLNKESRLLDSELKKVALSTFLFAILVGLIH